MPLDRGAAAHDAGALLDASMLAGALAGLLWALAYGMPVVFCVR